MSPAEPLVTRRAPTSATGHRLGIVAIVLASATPIAAAAAWIWVASTPGALAHGGALLAAILVVALALLAMAVAVVSLAIAKPNSTAKIALVLIGATGLVVAMLVYPPTGWFA